MYSFVPLRESCYCSPCDGCILCLLLPSTCVCDLLLCGTKGGGGSSALVLNGALLVFAAGGSGGVETGASWAGGPGVGGTGTGGGGGGAAGSGYGCTVGIAGDLYTGGNGGISTAENNGVANGGYRANGGTVAGGTHCGGGPLSCEKQLQQLRFIRDKHRRLQFTRTR
jgi:hypothetical protein